MEKLPASSLAECKDCQQLKWKIRSLGDREGTRFVYRDQEGHRWHRRRCPDCDRNAQIRRHGRGGIDCSLYPSTKKGRDAEHLARKYFERQGFEVEMTRLRGPDLTIRKRDCEFRVEVKAMFRSSKISRSYRVHSVSPDRRGDDLIAIVAEDGRVFVESMQSHLSKCLKNGTRTVTDLLEAANGRLEALTFGRQSG